MHSPFLADLQISWRHHSRKSAIPLLTCWRVSCSGRLYHNTLACLLADSPALDVYTTIPLLACWRISCSGCLYHNTLACLLTDLLLWMSIPQYPCLLADGSPALDVYTTIPLLACWRISCSGCLYHNTLACLLTDSPALKRLYHNILAHLLTDSPALDVYTTIPLLLANGFSCSGHLYHNTLACLLTDSPVWTSIPQYPCLLANGFSCSGRLYHNTLACLLTDFPSLSNYTKETDMEHSILFNKIFMFAIPEKMKDKRSKADLGCTCKAFNVEKLTLDALERHSLLESWPWTHLQGIHCWKADLGCTCKAFIVGKLTLDTLARHSLLESWPWMYL